MSLEHPLPAPHFQHETMRTPPYPVVFAVARPEQFSRMHMLARIVLFAMLSVVGMSLGAVFVVLYVMLPLLSAALISQKGPDRFLTEDGPWMERGLRWVMAGYAYLTLLTDALPGTQTDGPVRFYVQIGGWPSPASALKRLWKSLPGALMLAVLSIALWLIWVVAAIMIVITGAYPESLHDFQCGVLRWLARLLAYHASLVEQSPPFRFEPGSEWVA